jgi:integrase
MATVWKHPKSPFWTAVYRDEQNVWRKKTTKRKDRTKALTLAIEWDRAAQMGRDHTLTESASREIIGGILERTTGQKLRFDSVREFCAKWLRGKTAATAEGTSVRYGAMVERFLDFLEDRAERPINAIEPRDCQAFYDYRVEQKLAPATLVSEIKTLRNIFNSARRQGMISTNPAEAVETPQKVNHVERKVFTPEQVQMLLKETTQEPEWQTVILLGYYGGLRLGDAAARDWQDVDLAAHRLTFRMQKTGAALELPLHPVLESHLEQLAGDQGGPLCPGLAALRVSGCNGLSTRFIAIMRRAGISQESAESGGRRHLSTLSFHSLRKTFNSALHNKGVSQELRKKLTGHKSNAVNDRYTKSDLRTLRDAVTKLPKLSI